MVLVKTLGETRAVNGLDLHGQARRRLRRPWTEWRGQDDDDPDPGDAAPPRRGAARVLGHDVLTEGDAVRGLVSLTGQLASIDEDLTGRRTWSCWGGCWASPARAKTRASELLEAFGLGDAANKQVKNYPAACAGGSTSPPASSSPRS